MTFEEMLSSQPRRVLQAIEDQSTVVRYELHQTHVNQTVADHVGRCCQLMVVVMDDWFSQPHAKHGMVGKASLMACALTMMAMHDLSESVTGDVPYDTKLAVPEFQALEDRVQETLLQGIRVPHPEWSGHAPGIVEPFVRAVDMAELLLCCSREAEMGNSLILGLLAKAHSILHTQVQGLEELLHPYHATPLRFILDNARRVQIAHTPHIHPNGFQGRS